MQFESVSRHHRRKPCEVSSISTYPASNLHGDATDVSRVGLQRQENGYHSQIDCPHDLRRWCPAPQGTTNVGET
jgi:hypothetical protein